MTSILAFLFVFTIVVLAHEFGHFIAARRLGINVYEFSIGFPFSPRVATLFKYKGTEFTLRLLPLGGFVSFSRDDGSESQEFLKEGRWKRAIVASAGSIANFALAFLIFIAVFIVGKNLSLLDALVESLVTIKAVFTGTIHFLMSLFSGSGSMDSLSGPIGIAVMAGKAVDAGVMSLLYFTGFLSLSLGILNLLPLPALDGGHLVILAIETLKRRPLNQRTYQIVGLAGISLFLILTLVVSYRDIVKLIA